MAPARGFRGLSRARPSGGVRCGLAAALAMALAAAAISAGCAIFPLGSYWPAIAERRAGASPAAQAELRSLGPPAATEAEAAALSARLQTAVTRRWTSEDLARSARRMSAPAGQSVYADAMQAVVWYYVDEISYRRLVVAGIESLRAALDNPAFRRQFPETETADRRARLAAALDILDLKARASNPALACQAAEWLAVALEKNRAMLGLPDGAVVAEFLFGAMDSLDPYSRYMTAEMTCLYREQEQGRYVGIGAEITSRQGRFFVKAVFEHGPAAKAGLQAGDEIIAVDGRTMTDLTLSDVGRRLRGKPGTTVTLTLRSDGQGPPRDLAVTRAEVRLAAARDARLLDPARGIAYVRLAEFQEGAEADLRQAVESLARQGAKTLILDLRDNPGGSLLEAIWVAGMFLAPGPVIQTRGRMIGATWKYDVPCLARRAWTGPMAVLVNEDTASSAELVASALAERGRATIVGRRTFGKGAVQICFPIQWGAGAVCLTMARVYDAGGRCLDGRGVVPDIEVVPPESPPLPVAGPVAIQEDPVVRAAIEALAPVLQPAAPAAR